MNETRMMICSKCGRENPKGNVFCGVCGSRMGESSHGLDSISADDLTESKFLERALANKFRIESELGRGGFGVVFRAHDIQLDRTVAIKALHLTKSGDSQLVKRFMKEARLSARLEHPNIARIYTIDSSGVIHYFIMEFVNGPTIKECLNERGVFSPFSTVKYAKDVARALAFAHDNGIVHRDIKPANVILKNEQTAIVTDFGIAKALWTEATALTAGAIGTPMYMAPEQFRGEDLDGRSDQYSFGVMLYEMLTGEVPFVAQGSMLIQQQLFAPAPPIRQRNPDVPESLAAMAEKMLAKRKEDRFPDFHAILTAFDSLNDAGLPRENLRETANMTLSKPSVDQMLQEGRAFFDQKDYDTALQILQIAHDMDPDNIEVLFLLEQIRLKNENAMHVEGRIKEGIAKFHEGKYTEAIEVWKSAQEDDSSESEINKLIHQAGLRRDSTGRGDELKIEAIKAMDQQRYETAIQRLKAAKQLLKDDADIDRLLIQAESLNKQSREVDSFIQKANAEQKNRNYDAAIDLYRQLIAEHPDGQTAREHLEIAIKEQSRFAGYMAHENKWRALIDQGQFNRVLREMEEQESQFPDFSDLFLRLKQDVLAKKNQQAEAVKNAVRADELNNKKNSPNIRSTTGSQTRSGDHDHTIMSNQEAAAEIQPPRITAAPVPAAAPPKKSATSPFIWIVASVIILVLIGTGAWFAYVWLIKDKNPAVKQSAGIDISTPKEVQTAPPAMVTSTPTISIAQTPTVCLQQWPLPIEVSTPTFVPYEPPQAEATIAPTQRPTSLPKPTKIPQQAAPPTEKPTQDEDVFDGEEKPSGAAINRALRRAEKAKTEKQYRRVIFISTRILTADPSNEGAKRLRVETADILERADNMMKTAKRLNSEGDSGEADQLVKKVLELDPYNPEALGWNR